MVDCPHAEQEQADDTGKSANEDETKEKNGPEKSQSGFQADDGKEKPEKDKSSFQAVSR